MATLTFIMTCCTLRSHAEWSALINAPTSAAGNTTAASVNADGTPR